MGKLINHQEATQFLDQIPDPAVRGLLEYAYTFNFTERLPEPKADFDVLYFYRLMEAFLRDRQGIIDVLSGKRKESPFTAD